MVFTFLWLRYFQKGVFSATNPFHLEEYEIKDNLDAILTHRNTSLGPVPALGTIFVDLTRVEFGGSGRSAGLPGREFTVS